MTILARCGLLSVSEPIAVIGEFVHLDAMIVTIYDADSPIGEAEIFALDPPMGVAMAKFIPLPTYSAKLHANVVDGDYIEDRGLNLRMELADGVALKSQAISIQDWPALDEREVHILGILEPNFEELFREHPDYKSYWGEE